MVLGGLGGYARYDIRDACFTEAIDDVHELALAVAQGGEGAHEAA